MCTKRQSGIFVFVFQILLTLFVNADNYGPGTIASEAGAAFFSVPNCYLDIFLPQACRSLEEHLTSDILAQHLNVLNVFLAQNESESSVPLSYNTPNVTLTEDQFCKFSEINGFPGNCIRSDSTRFRDHVTCLDFDVLRIDRNHNYTTGIRISCSAAYPLDLQVDRHVPYEGMKVSFGKMSSRTRERLYTLQLQIPGTFQPGNLHEYSGNYTIYSQHNPHIHRRIALNISRKSRSVGNETLDDDVTRRLVLEFADGKVHCFTPDQSPVSLAVVQGSNPSELKLLDFCLSFDKFCSRKMLGSNCKRSGTFGSCKEAFPSEMQNVIARCSNEEDSVQKEFFTDLGLITYENISQVTSNQSIIFLRPITEESYLDYYDRSPSDMVTYDQMNVTFLCYFLEYFLVPHVEWSMTFHDGSKAKQDPIPVYHEESLKLVRGPENFQVRASKMTLLMETNMVSVECSSSFWNSDEAVSASLKLRVLPSEKPEGADLTRGDRERQEILLGDRFHIACQWKQVSPQPVYRWQFRGGEQSKTMDLENDSCVEGSWDATAAMSQLSVCDAKSTRNGTYICIAQNFRGEASQRINVHIQDMRLSSTHQWVYISLGVILSALVVVIIFFYRTYTAQKARLTAMEILAFEKGNEKELANNKMMHEIAHYLPYDKDTFEIPWQDFVCDDEELGCGAFGVVLKGHIGDRKVAVKTVRPDVDKSIVLALLSELKIMIYLGRHENIVQFIGACTEFITEGRPFVFVEFCAMGCLGSVLKRERKSFQNLLPKDQRSDSLNSGYVCLADNGGPASYRAGDESAEPCSFYENSRVITTADLIRWSSQIANAMDYLETKKVIHGDLAARNVLLTMDLVVKVTDFGLSKQLNHYQDFYVKQQQALLPWRWMAVESIRDMIFTSRSDVWSYGITLWEIFSLAELPYPGVTFTYEFFQSIDQGYRLRQPKYSSSDIYDMMLSCWSPIPEKRPSFWKLQCFFTEILTTITTTSTETNHIMEELLSPTSVTIDFSPVDVNVGHTINYRDTSVQL